ncbi:MAG: amidohydrolase family protein, partial [Desulfobacterales bacterium]
HVLHLSTADELELFTAGPVEGKRITAEACVHHLWFCDDDYERLGNRIKCNPAIKSARDRQALREALVADKIDVIGTDHAPHTREEKERPYLQAPSGLPLVQYALPALLELQRQGLFSLPQLVHKTSHAPARLFGIKARGFIREGYWADLVLVDPSCPTALDPGGILYKCGWSPFNGPAWRASVGATWVSGHLAYQAGQTPQGPRGMPLEFVPP